jgi:hypothetical protein
MSKRALDFAFAALLCASCIFLWFVADGFRGSPRYSQIDTDFWPKIVTGLAAVLTGIVAVQNGVGWLRERRGGAGDLMAFDGRRLGRMAAMGALVVAYFIAFDRVGFLISTVTFLWIAALSLPGGRLWTKIAFAPIFTVALTAMFSRVLGLPLPRGQGAFYDFSLMFY